MTPIHHLKATWTRKRQTSDEKRTTSEAPLYYSRDCSTNVDNIRQINLFLQNKPNFKKVKLSLSLFITRTYVEIDTWWNEKTNPIQTQFYPERSRRANPIQEVCPECNRRIYPACPSCRRLVEAGPPNPRRRRKYCQRTNTVSNQKSNCWRLKTK